MSDIKIGPGPGNLTPFSDYRQFLCKGTITKGMAVGFETATWSASNDNAGYSIIAASATVLPIGVAMESGVSGQWIKVCVEGFCNYVTVPNTTYTANHMMVAVASGESSGYALGTDLTTKANLVYGVNLKTEGSATTLLTSVWIHRKVAETDIPAGPGNPFGEQEFKEFLVGTAVAKGQLVTHQASDVTGYTIQPASNVLVPIGVAAQSGAAGDWVKVLVAGYCDFLTNDGTDIVSGVALKSVAAGVCATVATNVNINAECPGIVGVALRTDTTTNTWAYFFKRL